MCVSGVVSGLAPHFLQAEQALQGRSCSQGSCLPLRAGIISAMHMPEEGERSRATSFLQSCTEFSLLQHPRYLIELMASVTKQEVREHIEKSVRYAASCRQRKSGWCISFRPTVHGTFQIPMNGPQKQKNRPTCTFCTLSTQVIVALRAWL